MGELDQNNVLHLLGQTIQPGESARLNFNSAKLFTASPVEVPVIIERSKKPGPIVLFTAGVHGDEINGIEVVRQLISRKINRPKIGTIICIPVFNVFGFLNLQREFPDGRDLNRVFPGSKKGPLASRFAYQFTQEILPVVDYCVDFHTGGASRFNAPQIRIRENDEQLLELAHIFNAPFIVYSSTISKSYRASCYQANIPTLLFEGGKSLDNNKQITQIGVQGCLRLLDHLGMLKGSFDLKPASKPPILVSQSKWIRAAHSGLLHLKVACGKKVDQGEVLAQITDPYGSFRYTVKARSSGYIINVNESPIVYQGDALFHLSIS
ncbi:succinylglutamate desuccinylase/aspartoacylase family protein [Mesonia sediminis]|uniref:Succinylglutamate desuccinylase/aspartoacylase family protein n=1 Tax=Mesonia sediminis TaxID=1703946 RepID=A0ABW5SG20_9FLAO